MFNAQNVAGCIERKLQSNGYAKSGDADLIRANPLLFMDTVLRSYEKNSEEHEKRAADFWEKYERYVGCRLDEFGEDVAQQFASDIADLFK